jgi:hypothetical protein
LLMLSAIAMSWLMATASIVATGPASVARRPQSYGTHFHSRHSR